MLMSAADYRGVLRPLPAARVRQWPARRKRRRRAAAGARHRRVGVTYDFALKDRAPAADDGPPGDLGQDRQPHAAHRRDVDRSALQARGGAARLPRDAAARSAISRHDAPQRASSRRPSGSMPSARHRLSPALPRLPAPRPGRGPDARRRHDRRQGRPLQAARRAGQPRRLRAHQGAAAGRHRHPRHQGDRHGRALHARVPGHAVPHHDGRGRGLRGLLRGAGRCRRASPSSRARPAGPARAAAKFSARYGQSTGVVQFDDVFVPWDRVFADGQYEEAGFLTTSYATHHRHSCIGARAGFGDLLIGAGALMIEANGLDPDKHGHIRDAMVDLIKIVEGFFACGVAASVYAHEGSGRLGDAGRGVLQRRQAAAGDADLRHAPARALRLGRADRGAARPRRGPQPGDAASLAAVLAGRPDIPASQRLEVARLMEDLTASYTGGWMSLISLHGGGIARSDEARDLAQLSGRREGASWSSSLLDRGVLDDGRARLEAARPLLRHRLRSAGTPQGGGVTLLPLPIVFNGERVGVRGSIKYKRLRMPPPLTLTLSP